MDSRAAMTISVTGTCSKRCSPRPPAGFTLLEVLVVVAIIGVILTFAVLAIGGDRRAEELSRESRQFAELLRMGSEQAVLRAEEWGVQISDDDYRFLLFTDEGWVPREDDDIFRTRPFAEDTRLELELEGRDLVLETDSENEIKPTLLLLSSGEVSPFSALFAADTTEHSYRVSGDLRGEIGWEAVDPW